MSQFQVGDKVVAVEKTTGLLQGEEYTVCETFEEEGHTFVKVKDHKGNVSGGWFPHRFVKKEDSMSQPNPKAEKIQTLADMISADPGQVKPDLSNIFHCNGQMYWVVTESEKGNGAGPAWRWLGQLGDIHVFKKMKD